MAGLVKGKDYDWKDSNIAMVGSDEDRSVKKAAAETEPAWKGAGSKVGMQVWRIVKFKVTHWPKDDYGKFYQGDSYILLNTYKEKDSDALLYDVHFWIGKESTQVCSKYSRLRLIGSLFNRATFGRTGIALTHRS